MSTDFNCTLPVFILINFNIIIWFLDEIISATGNQHVVVQTVDMSSLQSVREFAKKILATERRLDVLIHNAGTAHMFGSKTTSDGLELTMATNYFGPFLLTHLLIGKKFKLNYIQLCIVLYVGINIYYLTVIIYNFINL